MPIIVLIHKQQNSWYVMCIYLMCDGPTRGAVVKLQQYWCWCRIVALFCDGSSQTVLK